MDLFDFNDNEEKAKPLAERMRAATLDDFVGQKHIVAEGSLLRKTMANPVVEREGGGTFTGRIVPIYPLTAGVSQTILMRSVAQGLAACRDQLLLEDGKIQFIVIVPPIIILLRVFFRRIAQLLGEIPMQPE